jgi:hypothetical protein
MSRSAGTRHYREYWIAGLKEIRLDQRGTHGRRTKASLIYRHYQEHPCCAIALGAHQVLEST